MMQDIHKLPNNVCPGCGHTLNACISEDKDHCDKPISGDITLCFCCGTILSFGEDMELVIVTNEDINHFPTEVKHQVLTAQMRLRGRTLS